MQYLEFIDRVQERAQLASREEAILATEATLETLGERVSSTEREDLAAQLPAEIKEYLHRRSDTARFALEDFYKRVSARADVRFTHGVALARAVMAVLAEAVSQGELADILRELPSEYVEILRQPTEGS